MNEENTQAEVVEVDAPETLAPVKEKPKKVKKEKKKLTKKQLLILVFSIVGAVVVGLGSFGIVTLIQTGKKIDQPTGLGVRALSEKVYIVVDENERAEKYLFQIKVAGQTSSITVPINSIDATNYLSNAGSYSISVKYIGKRQSANSDFSAEITYNNTVNLDAPVIGYSEQSKTISFVPVPNATSYTLYYMNQSGTMQFHNIPATSSNQNVKVNMTEFFNGKRAGLYEFSVVAVGTGHYSTSSLSNKISVEHGLQLKKVSDVAYNQTRHLLSFDNEMETTTFRIKVTLDGLDNVTITFDYQAPSPASTVEVDLTPHLQTSVKRIEVIAIGDGNYTYDSQAEVFTA